MIKARPAFGKTTSMTELNHDQFMALWGRIDGLQAKGYIVNNMTITHNLGSMFVEINVHKNEDADPLEPGDTWFCITQYGNVIEQARGRIAL